MMMFITLEKPIKRLKDELSGKGLAWYHYDLDALAERLGLPPLSDFVSMEADEAAELLEGVKDEVGNPIEIPEEQWFSATEGLRTVRGLLAHFTEKQSALKALVAKDDGSGEGVLQDLREAEKILVQAEKRKVRFHLTCAY